MIRITHIAETMPADSEAGDDISADVEQLEVTFRELVDLIGSRGFFDPSCSPASGSRHEWLNTYPQQDYRTGDWERESIHFSPCNPLRLEKYWKKAMRAAGIIKGAA